MSNKADAGRIPGLLVLAALASAALHVWLARAPSVETRPVALLVVHGVLTALMLSALLPARRLERRTALWIALAGAAAFRIILVAGPPLLSPDLHRYLVDGQMAVAGVNPYARPPADPVFDALPEGDREKVIYPELPTIYPPTAQASFLAVVGAGGGTLAWKALVACADFGVLLLLVTWPGRARDPAVALLYGWHPLVIVETAGSGHLEPLGVLLMVVAARGIIAGRRGVSTLAWTGAVLVKLQPLVAAPAVLRRCGGWRAVGLSIATAGVLYWPYRRLGAEVLGSLGVYARRWSFNSPAYESLRAALEGLGAPELLAGLVTGLREASGFPPWMESLYAAVHPELVARAGLGAALALVVAFVWWRRPGLEAEILAVSAAAFYLTPTLHPWYFLWVLPWAILRDARPLLLQSFLLPVSYLASARGEPAGAALMAVQFLPVVAWALLRMRGRRRATGPILGGRSGAGPG